MGTIENIQSLITAANATTGKADADMTEATKSLIAGYGGGGSDVLRMSTEDTYPLRMQYLHFSSIKNIEIDCKNSSGEAPGFLYCYFPDATDGAVITVNNCENREILGDYFRGANPLKAVNFSPEVKIKRWWRLFNETGRGAALQVRNISLSALDVSGGYYPSNSRLLDITWTGELKVETTFASANLTPESLRGIIQHLADYSGGVTHTITLSAKQQGYLTESDIALATSRGWTIA